MTNCKGCEERHIGCHSHCETYAELKKRIEEDKKRRRAESDKEHDFASVRTYRRYTR